MGKSCLISRFFQSEGAAMNAEVLERNLAHASAHEQDLIRTEERLESLMQCRLGNRVRGLRVLLTPLGIILTGRTSTYHAKQLAQHAAMELSTHQIVSNDIEVC